jgi:MATE family multidrug resistance protein
MALFVSMGWGGCAQTFTGMCVGAGDTVRAARAGWYATFYNTVTMVLLATLFVTQGHHLLGVFTQSAPVLALAAGYVAQVAPSYTLYGVAIVLGNAIMGAGATRLALRVDATLVFGVQFPLMVAVVALLHAPVTDLWRTIVVVNAINAIVYALLFRRTSWWQPKPVGA